MRSLGKYLWTHLQYSRPRASGRLSSPFVSPLWESRCPTSYVKHFTKHLQQTRVEVAVHGISHLVTRMYLLQPALTVASEFATV